MGSISRVRCRKCGFDSGDLLGVGGDVGFAGRPVWTVWCDTEHSLTDVWASERPASKKGYLLKISIPEPKVRCPHCRKVHRVWNPKTGICPKCGAQGCKVKFVGNWD